ncbi:MAG: DUF302 domain-containing protein [Chlamydiales bacterium]|nr:DUF302 domain-containing protein [Chlamydiales bacterium]
MRTSTIFGEAKWYEFVKFSIDLTIIETMQKKGVPFDRECQIFEICQPQQAKRVLEQNMSLSTALPCRISLYQEGSKTMMATIRWCRQIFSFVSREIF